PVVPARGPHLRARATSWMMPLRPLEISAAVPATKGAASPPWCTCVGIVTNASTFDENTHGASGSAQLNARATPTSAEIECPEPQFGSAGAGRVARRAATTAATVDVATRT